MQMKKTMLVLIVAVCVLMPLIAGGNSETASTEKSKGPLTWIWYPNESTPEFAEARSAIIQVAAKALGREIREQTTTDYAIAIEALVNDNAAFSWFGGEGYTQAHARNPKVLPLVTNSPSETLDNAKYYSMLGVLKENGSNYMVNGKYDLDTIKQQKFSFVSNSSTSGFRVPSSIISKHYGVDPQDLLEGGTGKVFAEVMFGGSHQGSFYNVLSGKADVAAFCNECIYNYVDWTQANYSDPIPGDVIKVLAKADPPFDKVAGKEVVFIATVPVLNAPIVMNTDLLSEDEISALKAAFTSEETMKNEKIFAPTDSGVKSFFRAGNRFLLVEDGWYDPIRKLSGLL